MKQEQVILEQSIPKFSLFIVFLPVLLLVGILSVFKIYYIFLLLFLLPFFWLSYEYCIQRNFENFVYIKIFGTAIYQKKKVFIVPDYISLNHQGYKEGGTWMWYPTIFGDARYKLYAIKFFKGNKNQTVFKTPYKEEARLKAEQLSTLLDIRIHNTLKT
ncbi:hypothetical protein [Aureibaculum conchae]|uniref:hypothetical protein n=1 Tax=Aureibaculum sp. 2308TA14-22 TaxID=3108392 RepID=UPI003398B82E